MQYSVFDAHCDTALKLYFDNESLIDNNLMVSAKKCENYEKTIYTMAIFNEGKLKKDDILKIINRIKSEAKKCEKYNFKTIISIEGLGNTPDYEPSFIQRLKNEDVKIISLTWNGDNMLCGGIVNNNIGITSLGKETLSEMKKNDITLDFSHISDKGFYDCLDNFDGKVCATHSNSRKICSHNRNLTDDMFLQIKKRNGVVGINLYPLFLSDTKSGTLNDIIKHIEHFLSLDGENNIGIGADFDGIDYTPDEIKSCKDLYVLFDYMKKLNYSEDIINKISHLNFEKMLNIK